MKTLIILISLITLSTALADEASENNPATSTDVIQYANEMMKQKKLEIEERKRLFQEEYGDRINSEEATE